MEWVWIILAWAIGAAGSWAIIAGATRKKGPYE